MRKEMKKLIMLTLSLLSVACFAEDDVTTQALQGYVKMKPLDPKTGYIVDEKITVTHEKMDPNDLVLKKNTLKDRFFDITISVPENAKAGQNFSITSNHGTHYYNTYGVDLLFEITYKLCLYEAGNGMQDCITDTGHAVIYPHANFDAKAQLFLVTNRMNKTRYEIYARTDIKCTNSRSDSLTGLEHSHITLT